MALDSREFATPAQAYLSQIDTNADVLVQADGGGVRFHKLVTYQPTSPAPLAGYES
jgi:hypothetical protein